MTWSVAKSPRVAEQCNVKIQSINQNYEIYFQQTVVCSCSFMNPLTSLTNIKDQFGIVASDHGHLLRGRECSNRDLAPSCEILRLGWSIPQVFE
ncbi:hypothetical protein TNCV_3370601 [Trichonephila clavipes]|nr:hypothetical protein TNCV_3370601 [Trichonephila clavipes]